MPGWDDLGEDGVQEFAIRVDGVPEHDAGAEAEHTEEEEDSQQAPVEPVRARQHGCWAYAGGERKGDKLKMTTDNRRTQGRFPILNSQLFPDPPHSLTTAWRGKGGGVSDNHDDRAELTRSQWPSGSVLVAFHMTRFTVLYTRQRTDCSGDSPQSLTMHSMPVS